MAELIPFPRARNRPRIEGFVRELMRSTPADAEHCLGTTLAAERALMLGQGFGPAAVQSEIAAVDRAIRAEILRALVAAARNNSESEGA